MPARAGIGNAAVLRRPARHGRDDRSTPGADRSAGRARARRGARQLPRPAPGTPLAIRKPVRPLEAIRWIALFRLGLPDVILRYAGGRELTLGELQAMGMTAGINASDRRQLPDHPGPQPGGRSHHAPRPPHADRGDLQRHLIRRAARFTPREPATARDAGARPSPARAVVRAGAPTSRPAIAPCAGAGSGSMITPAAWTARCRQHGPIGSSGGAGS